MTAPYSFAGSAWGRTSPRLCLAALLVAALFATAAYADELQRYSRTELHMGVEFQVVLYASEASPAEQALSKAHARIAALDEALSDYDTDSELSRLSQTSTTTELKSPQPFPGVKVSDDLWAVLSVADQLSRDSGGA